MMASSSPTKIFSTVLPEAFRSNSNAKHAKVPLLPVSHDPNSNRYQTCPPTIVKFTFLILLSFVLLGFVAYYPRIHQEISLGPKAPLIHLTALSVHKFNISETNMTAQWEVKFKIRNPNLVSYIWFDRVEGFIMYEDTVPLAIEVVEPFGLAMKRDKELHVKLAVKKWEGVQPALKEGVLQKIKRDRKKGGVKFSAQMAVWATYRSGWWWSKKHVIMNPQCLDLQVGFVPGTTAVGFGILMSDVPRTCYVPMLAS